MLSLKPTSRVRSVLFDLLVAAGIAGLTCLGIFNRQTPSATMVLGFIMAGAIVFRRRFPKWSMAVVSLAALTQVILFEPSHDPLPFDLAVLVGMFSVVKYGRRMLDAYLAAATVATGIVIEVVRHWSPNGLALTVFYLGVCGGLWLMAYTMRTRRLYVAGLEERAATLERERDHLARIAVADERAAIARELHDVVAHSLSVMIVQADGGRYAFEADPRQALAALETVAATGREALADMRRLVGVLRGSDVDAAETQPAHRRLVGLDELGSLAERARSAGLTVDLRIGPGVAELPQAVELAVVRLSQEALTNVLRHAGPHARVTVDVEYIAGTIEINIIDDGGESLLERVPPPPAGHGLIGMRERVAVHGGQLVVGPRLDGGWSVRATIPLPSRPEPVDACAGDPEPASVAA